MFAWLVHNTVLAALLAVGVAGLCRVTRCRPAIRHVLWLIVLVRLLLPPAFHWPWALPVQPAPTRTVAPLTEAAVADAAVEVNDGDWVVANSAEEAATETVTETVSTPVEPVPFRWTLWVGRSALAVWLLGSAFVLGRHLLRLRRLRRWVKLGTPAPGGLTARAAELAAKLHIRPPRVLAVPGLASPLVGCLPRPVLLWPEGLETRLTSDGVKAVLAHELAHLKRRDHWVRWLEILAEGVWWWHPLFALVRRKIRQNAELACDAWVVALLPAARRAYAEALLTVCETASRPAEPAPALGVGGDDRRDFQRRLTMIMREPATGRLPRRALLAVGLLGLLAIPGWTLGQHPAPPADPDEVRTEEPLTNPDIGVDDTVFMLELLDSADDAKAQPAGAEREKKLQELEARIQAILQEIRALRKAETQKQREARLAELKAKSQAAEQIQRAQTKRGTEWLQQMSQAQQKKADQKQLGFYPPAEALLRSARRTDGAVNLTRATYTLPPAKAASLGAFLKEHLKASVVETTVEGDKLTVTTTPEAQKAIGQLVNLILGQTGGARRETKPVPPTSYQKAPTYFEAEFNYYGKTPAKP